MTDDREMHPGPKGVKSICFLGQPVCVAAISRLVGLGTERVTKMRRAFRQREDCPTDGRLFGKARRFGDKKQTAKREVVHDFLHYLYTEVSEPMPETVTDVHEGQSLSTIVPRMLRFRKARGKRPKMFEKRAKEKIDEEGAKKVRFLPPGSFTDYLKLLRARVPDVHVSLKLFCKEPWTGHAVFSFAPKSFCGLSTAVAVAVAVVDQCLLVLSSQGVGIELWEPA